MKPMILERSLRALRWLTPVALGLLLATSCSEPSSSPQIGSETHFLMGCDETSCDAGMQCICGVCSKPCVQQDDCRSLSAAASCTPLRPRVTEGRCDATQIGAMCDAGCLLDDDCAAFSPDSRCEGGFCREPGTAVEPGPQTCAPSSIAPQDVMILGDVSIELTIFTEQLEQSAVVAGSLAEGQHYRNESSAMSSLLAAGPLSFDAQYTIARQAGVPRVIIMDGGATDILNDNCAGMLTPDCPAARAAVDGAEQLFARFARDGVEQLVYFFYGDPIDNPGMKDGFDLMRPLLENACGRSPLPCHFLDLRPIFDGHPEYVDVDGFVFTPEGATAAAQATFELMQARCVAN
jgi:hypothetical protein